MLLKQQLRQLDVISIDILCSSMVVDEIITNPEIKCFPYCYIVIYFKVASEVGVFLCLSLRLKITSLFPVLFCYESFRRFDLLLFYSLSRGCEDLLALVLMTLAHC